MASTAPVRRAPPRAVIILVAALVLAGVAWAVVRAVAPAGDPPGILRLSGRIEGYPTEVAPKTGGRVIAVGPREGMPVRRGETLVRLDDAAVRAQLDAAGAQVVAAEHALAAARAARAVLDEQSHEAGLGVAQAGADAAARIGQAAAGVAAAQAGVAQARSALAHAQSDAALAARDRDRFAALARTGDVAAQRADQADTAARSAATAVRERRAALDAAQRQVAAAQSTLALARSTTYNAEIRAAQSDAIARQRAQLDAQIAAAAAQRDAAIAQRRVAAVALSDLTLASPIDGVVITRSVEPGEIVSPGKPLLTIVDLSRVYLRGFIPEGRIGGVRAGQAARVRLDSAPERPLDARVGEIDTEASFTPENVYFKDDRVQQVFGVKLELTAPGGFAKPGMPADAEILLDAGAKR